MRIAIVGCGGIGGVIAGVMAAKGHPVTCVTGRKTSAHILKDKGISIKGKLGDFHVQVNAYSSLAETSNKFDIVVLGVKSNVLRSLFTAARERVCNNGFILTLQNGIEILSIVQEFPDARIVCGAVSYNSIMAQYGEYLVTCNGGISVGTLKNTSSEDLFLFKALLEPRIKIDTTDTPEALLWSKLILVCGITGLGGISGLLAGELLKHKVARRLFYTIVTEGTSVTDELGISLEGIGKTINPKRFGNHKAGYPLFIRFLLLRIAGSRYRNLKSNITHSLERGRKTEIGFINGAVVKSGKELGIDTPLNAGVVRMVREIEQGKRSMGMHNLYELYDLYNLR